MQCYNMRPGFVDLSPTRLINHLTVGPDYIRIVIFYQHIKYQLFNMVKLKHDINQQDFKTVGFRFVQSE